MASAKLRSSSCFLALLLSSLNVVLFLLAAASLVPLLLLRRPPSPFGWALLAVSAATLLSSLLGFCSALLCRCCSAGHIALVVAASLGQATAVMALLLREERSTSMVASQRSPGETRFLLRLEAAALISMFVVQSAALILSCAVRSCWLRDYEGAAAERERAAWRRSRRMARVQEESLANAAAMGEVKARELEEKLRVKYGQLPKQDIEG